MEQERLGEVSVLAGELIGLAMVVWQPGQGMRSLGDGWRCVSMPAGTATQPAELPPKAAWLAAPVPGDVAMARRAASRLPEPPTILHAEDHWYRLDAALPPGARLEFAGLTTPAEVW